MKKVTWQTIYVSIMATLLWCIIVALLVCFVLFLFGCVDANRTVTTIYPDGKKVIDELKYSRQGNQKIGGLIVEADGSMLLEQQVSENDRLVESAARGAAEGLARGMK